MKEVKIKQITLRNFKGTRERTVEFSNVTQIKGDNKTGKSTIVDAYNWVLFGKDSKGDTDFDIKTLDENNEPIHKLDHEVELILQDDTKLRKVYKEVWRTKRGESEEQLTGHTTDYFVDDVPKSKTEYESKVASIIDADIARLISDTKYFNEILDWKQRRQVISDMVQTPTVEEIEQNSPENLQEVVSLINQGKVLEDEKLRVQRQKKLSKDELKTIDPKIDENRRMKPEPLDYDTIEKNIEEKQGQLSSVEKSINDVSAAYQEQANASAELIRSKSDKEREYSRLDSDNRNTPNAELDSYYKKLNTIKDELQSLNDQHTDEVRKLNSNYTKLEQVENELVQLRSEYSKISASSFVQGATSCPTCKREYDNAQEKQEELRANFNTDRAEKLKVNKEKGLAKAEEKKTIESEIKAIEDKVLKLSDQVKAKQAEIDSLVKPSIEHQPTPEMIALQSEIDAIVIPEIVRPDTSELKEQKKVIQEEIDRLKKQLATRDQAESIDKRIKELTNQKRALAQQIADLEKLEFAIETYQNSEVDLIEKRVNDKFSIVRFKMFEKQMNGGTKQTCVAMVNGVPYKSVNTAGQIQASLDIINTIQHHYQTFAPVFIDNAESITDIPTMNCQTVQLYVEKGKKELEVISLD